MDDEAEYRVIQNGYDGEVVRDLVEKLTSERSSRPRLLITYTGGLTNGRDLPLKALLDALRKLNQEGKESIQLRLIGCNYGWLSRQYGDLIAAGILEVKGLVSHEEAISAILESDYALQLNAKEHPYLVSTKIYESAICRVPAISLNYGGSIDALIKNHGLGYSLQVDDCCLVSFLQELPKDSTEKFAFDVEPFDHKNLAERYGELIDELDERS